MKRVRPISISGTSELDKALELELLINPRGATTKSGLIWDRIESSPNTSPELRQVIQEERRRR